MNVLVVSSKLPQSGPTRDSRRWLNDRFRVRMAPNHMPKLGVHDDCVVSRLVRSWPCRYPAYDFVSTYRYSIFCRIATRVLVDLAHLFAPFLRNTVHPLFTLIEKILQRCNSGGHRNTFSRWRGCVGLRNSFLSIMVGCNDEIVDGSNLLVLNHGSIRTAPLLLFSGKSQAVTT